MTLTIDVPPEVERILIESAQRTGQSVTEFAAALLARLARLEQERASQDRQAEIAARLAALERICSYDTRRRAGLPPLSEDATGRENIYEGRGQ